MIKIIIKLKKVILASLSKLRVSGEPGWRVSKFMKCRARNKLGDKNYTDVIFITPPRYNYHYAGSACFPA